MTRFVQLCASQNNLFALDEDGNVYQYHFNVRTWVRLAVTRDQPEDKAASSPPHPHPALAAGLAVRP